MGRVSKLIHKVVGSEIAFTFPKQNLGLMIEGSKTMPYQCFYQSKV